MKRKGSPPPSPLLAIADHSMLGGSLLREAVRAWEGGVRWMLLRARELTPREREALAGELKAAMPGLFLSVHGGPEGFVVPGGKGVHHQSALIEKCAETSPGMCAGASCHDAAELARAYDAGADYVFLSPFAPPHSKKTDLTPLGFKGLHAAARKAAVPVYALGGIRPEDVAGIKEAGAAGIAVSGGIFTAGDVFSRARLYVEAVEKTFGKV